MKKRTNIKTSGTTKLNGNGGASLKGPRAGASKSHQRPMSVSIGKPNGTETHGLPVTVSQLDARPDTIDFRDQMYVPTLFEVPTRITLAEYQASYKSGKPPILNQGKEGACTGFGLAAVANFLLQRRKVVPDSNPVSARMFYEMARRYDEWPGENYSGSSARGAMKGWHKHGVCSGDAWAYSANHSGGTLTHQRAEDAAKRPLGAYFRVNHKQLVAMHSALAEVGILFATASVHRGWGQISKEGVIPFTNEPLGGHAFAIVGYDQRGFWIQNSWGGTWGVGGFALITYEDWLVNGTDVWVARLGAPTMFVEPSTQTAHYANPSTRSEFSFTELRPHIISIGNDGLLRPDGTFGTKEEDVKTILNEDMPRLTKTWKNKRLLLYAHGGLVGEGNALQRVEEYRQPLLEAEVYPLAFIWKTDLWTTLKNILADAMSRRRPEGILDSAKDFLLDRLDDTLEPIARPIGKPVWGEMKENALLATEGSDGGAKFVLQNLKTLLKADPSWEIHIAGHSAGSIFMAPVVEWFRSEGLKVGTLSLWAPACTMKLFHDYYMPALTAKTVESFSLFTLKDAAEQDDDCANIYNKSLLYLVANAFEETSGLFFADGEPLLGMEQFIIADPAFETPTEKKIRSQNPPVVPILGLKNAEWIRSPNGLIEGNVNAAHARRHGDFDDDKATVLATLRRIVGTSDLPSQSDVEFAPSATAMRDRRNRLARVEAAPRFLNA
jgi:hypothetical protein